MRGFELVEIVVCFLEVGAVCFPGGNLLFLFAHWEIGGAGNKYRRASSADGVFLVDGLCQLLSVAVEIMLGTLALGLGFALGLDFFQHGGGTVYRSAVFTGGAVWDVVAHAHVIMGKAGGGFVDFVVHGLSLLCFIHVCLGLFKGREPVCINIGQKSVVPFILGLVFRLQAVRNRMEAEKAGATVCKIRNDAVGPAAEAAGQSIKEYVTQAIQERMERER